MSDLYKAIFRNSSIGMAVVQSDGRILMHNPAFRELARHDGHSMPEFLWDLIAERDRQPSMDRVATLVHPGERYSWVVNVDAASRAAIWQLDVSVVSGLDGKPLLLVNVRDITLQKNTELRLKRARDDAERATKTKSAFLANMSHEIRTPIHTVTGMTELLLETQLDEEQQEYANQVRFAADVLLYLINDILDFSKIEAGKLSLEKIEYELVGVIEEAVDMVSLEAHKKGLEVIVAIAAGVPRRVQGDPGRLRQIIVNLFNNAVKFTPEGGEIEIVGDVVASGGNESRVRVEVRDTGIGIPEEKLHRLFSAFTQVDSSTTRKYGGTGLGLSICQSLVEMMGGAIGVESVEGDGSTFWFEIPFPVVEPAAAPEPIASGKRVLLVDDNETSSEAVAAYISRWGGEVTSVGTGQEALAALRAGVERGAAFDLALLDLELPGMDGWQLAGEINNDPAVESTPLILLSPSGLMAREAKMKRLMWFTGYARKPISLNELGEEIGKALAVELEPVPEELEPVDDDESVEEVSPVSMRIVVAEDHLINQTLFKAILQKLGHQVYLAANGKEALDAVIREEPDLVFMDVQMPEMNGYEATAAIRQAEYVGPVIAVTANAAQGEREKCIEAGMNDFLSKPFKRDDIVPLLDKWAAADRVGGGDAMEPDGEATRTVGDPGFEIAEDLVGGALAGPDAPDFSLHDAIERFAGNADVVRRVLEQFIAKTDAITSELESALEAKDYAKLQIEAHGLKGGARNLDAPRLGDAAAMLEGAAKLGDPALCRHYLDALPAALEAFSRAASQALEQEA
jgi:PAS domain S-box-containing protein